MKFQYFSSLDHLTEHGVLSNQKAGGWTTYNIHPVFTQKWNLNEPRRIWSQMNRLTIFEYQV